MNKTTAVLLVIAGILLVVLVFIITYTIITHKESITIEELPPREIQWWRDCLTNKYEQKLQIKKESILAELQKYGYNWTEKNEYEYQLALQEWIEGGCNETKASQDGLI
jgi:hypothetical protein